MLNFDVCELEYYLPIFQKLHHSVTFNVPKRVYGNQVVVKQSF